MASRPRSAGACWWDEQPYLGLMQVDRALLAWEWLRRDPAYRAAAQGRSAIGCCATEDRGALVWELHAFEDPSRGAPFGRPVWTRAAMPAVLDAEAEPAAPVDEKADLLGLSLDATLVVGPEAEHLLISDGRAALRLDLAGGGLRFGPVGLQYRLAGTDSLRAPLGTLHRLLAVLEGRSPRPDVEGRQRRARAVALIRTSDALAAGATQREIAEALSGDGFPSTRWRVNDPSLRSRVQRLVRDARAMERGGWRELLR